MAVDDGARLTRVTPINGRIIDAANIPGGIVALVARRSLPPQLIVSRTTTTTTVSAAAPGAETVTRALSVAWPNVTVTALDLNNPKAGKDPNSDLALEQRRRHLGYPPLAPHVRFTHAASPPPGVADLANETLASQTLNRRPRRSDVSDTEGV